MSKKQISTLIPVKLALWGAIFFSTEALVYYKGSLKVFNVVIASCIGLALLGAIQTVVNNFYEVHFTQWTSLVSVTNLAFRSFTRLLVLREPQTMYFLLAIILWAVRQFVSKALVIKNENEAFV